MALGKILTKARISADLSQRDVSIKLGYSTPQFISNWERGVSVPPPDVTKILESLYNVEIANKVVEERVRTYRKKIERQYLGEKKAS